MKQKQKKKTILLILMLLLAVGAGAALYHQNFWLAIVLSIVTFVVAWIRELKEAEG